MRIIIPITAALLLGACGADDRTGAGAGDRAAKAREATLTFARCMREHGVDIPDPKVGEGGEIRIGGPGVGRGDPDKLMRAQKACREHLEAIEPPQLTGEQKAQIREDSLAHARCMREHGLDFPDPKFTDDGGAMVRIGPGTGLDPRSPRFQAAQRECVRERRGGAVGGGATEEVSP